MEEEASLLGVPAITDRQTSPAANELRFVLPVGSPVIRLSNGPPRQSRPRIRPRRAGRHEFAVPAQYRASTPTVQWVGGHKPRGVESDGVERSEAEAIYDQGRGVVVRVLVELSAQNERLTVQVQALSARVARQEERIAQLEREGKRSSRNSSQPPSADPPASLPRRGKDPSGRGQGAQLGHEGRGRPLLPAWAVEEVIDHWPERCGCGHAFTVEEHVAVGEPVRWQVEELPVISVGVSEHRCQRVRCPGCGERTRGKLPRRVGQSAFGPRFQAAVATLSVRNRISRRDVVELCERCSPRGSARARWTRSSAAARTRSSSRTPICWPGFVALAR